MASVVERIAAIRADNKRDERDRTLEIYAVKTAALIDVIQPMLGQAITHQGFTFRINSAEATPEYSLVLDVTFTRPPGNPVTHQIIIVNPPVLPRRGTGNEKEDLIGAVQEMLEGFV